MAKGAVLPREIIVGDHYWAAGVYRFVQVLRVDVNGQISCIDASHRPHVIPPESLERVVTHQELKYIQKEFIAKAGRDLPVFTVAENEDRRLDRRNILAMLGERWPLGSRFSREAYADLMACLDDFVSELPTRKADFIRSCVFDEI